MQKKLNQIENKIDKLDERLDKIDVTLAAQHESLKYHIKRTDLIESSLEPINTHVKNVQGALKLIGLVAVLAGIIEGLFVVLEYFKN